MNRTLAFLTTIALAAIPARASVTYSIVPVTLTLNPGTTGNLFEVLLTDSVGGSSFKAASFSFDVSTTDTDIMFESVSTVTNPDTYIFEGNSLFAPDITGAGAGTQTISAGDLTADSSDQLINPGDILALGEVSFDIAPNAALGPFTVTFGDPATDILADSTGTITTSPDTLTPQQFTIQASVPEPSESLPLAIFAFLGWNLLRRNSGTFQRARSRAGVISIGKPDKKPPTKLPSEIAPRGL